SRPCSSAPRTWPWLNGEASLSRGMIFSGSCRPSTGAAMAAKITIARKARLTAAGRSLLSLRRSSFHQLTPAVGSPAVPASSPSTTAVARGPAITSGDLRPETRVEDEVDHVDRKVDEDERHRDDHHSAEDHGQVALADGLEHQAADPGPAEDDLHEDHAAQE